MFNLCKSRYQGVLQEQKWNYLNQRFDIYLTVGEKCVPSALNWNYWSYIFNNKNCLNSPFLKVYGKREMVTQRRTLSMLNPGEDCLQRKI